MQKDVRKVLGLTLFLAAFTAACDNNPLKDDRDKGAYMFTNPSFATVVVGDNLIVTARVMNKYTAPTGDAVTGTPCDSKITAVKDTTRTDFEAPERFLVTATAVGRSCLIVTGGGVTDTISFLNGPGAVKLSVGADSSLASGGTKPLTVTFRDFNGNTITGLTIANVTFVSRDTLKVKVDPVTNIISGFAPGTTFLVATLKDGLGQIVKDSIPITVSAGPFGGTKPASVARGGLTTLTAGAVPFDANTAITVNGLAVYVQSNTPTTYTFVTPDLGAATTSAVIVVANLGPSDIANTFTVPYTAEAGEPDAQTSAGARPLVLGTFYYGTVSATDTDDFYKVDLTTGTSIVVNVDWFPGTAATTDIDVLVTRPTGSVNGACATGAKPENCTISITSTGTHFIDVNYYSSTVGALAYRLKIQ